MKLNATQVRSKLALLRNATETLPNEHADLKARSLSFAENYAAQIATGRNVFDTGEFDALEGEFAALVLNELAKNNSFMERTLNQDLLDFSLGVVMEQATRAAVQKPPQLRGQAIQEWDKLAKQVKPGNNQ